MIAAALFPVAGAADLSPWQAALLGALQGITEFLPISSSAHLYIVPEMLGWRYQGLAFDVALHWGTLLALVVAFWRDWLALARGSLRRDAEGTRARGMLARLAAASVPAAIAGLLLEDTAERYLRAPALQAAMLVLFGLLLWLADRAPRGRTPAAAGPGRLPGWGTSLWVGVAQALALVPGVSRSGVTMTAGRATGLDRVTAARFSFLLATPITFGAGLLELRHLSNDLPATTLAAGVVSAAVVGLLTIRGLLRWLTRAGFGAFCAYRVALAAAILAWLALR
jgi:undecaprenyl-diphosphatase